MKKAIKKAQTGIKAKPAKKDSVPSEMFPGKMIPKSKSTYATGEFAKSLEKSKKDSSSVKKPAPPKKNMKSGGKVMMKRADGSVSQRGLWDNIRANKGSGKKPTAQMLKQEKKIKAQSKKK
jgi:hypothetical protein